MHYVYDYKYAILYIYSHKCCEIKKKSHWNLLISFLLDVCVYYRVPTDETTLVETVLCLSSLNATIILTHPK